MTKKETKKLQKIELDAWNRYACAENACTDKNWVDCCRHNWFGVHMVLEELNIHPIFGEDRLCLNITKKVEL